MATQAIPREQWNSFFDGFSKDHLGQSATLEVFGSAIGDQTVAEQQLFGGVSADLKDRESRIAIQLGASIDDGTTHSVSAPTEVWLKDGADEAETRLEIRSSDSSTFILRFAQEPLLT